MISKTLHRLELIIFKNMNKILPLESEKQIYLPLTSPFYKANAKNSQTCWITVIIQESDSLAIYGLVIHFAIRITKCLRFLPSLLVV